MNVLQRTWYRVNVGIFWKEKDLRYPTPSSLKLKLGDFFFFLDVDSSDTSQALGKEHGNNLPEKIYYSGKSQPLHVVRKVGAENVCAGSGRCLFQNLCVCVCVCVCVFQKSISIKRKGLSPIWAWRGYVHYGKYLAMGSGKNGVRDTVHPNQHI